MRPIVLAALAMCVSPAAADVLDVPTWLLRFDGFASMGYSVDAVPAGGFVAAGTPAGPFQGAALVRLDEQGTVLWERTVGADWPYNGGNAPNVYVRSSNDGGFCIAAILSSGDPSKHTTFHAALAKLDANGELVWQLSSGAGNESVSGVTALADGGCLFSGGVSARGHTRNPRTAFWLMRANAAGAPVWSRTYDTTTVNSTTSGLELSGGDLLLAGSTYGSDGRTTGLVTRLAPEGTIRWQRSLEVPNGLFVATSAASSAGELFVGGAIASNDFSTQDGAFLLKLDTDGNVMFSNLYPGPYSIEGIALGESGRISMAGQVYDRSNLVDGFSLVADAAGVPITGRIHGSPDRIDQLNDVCASPDGGIVMVGTVSQPQGSAMWVAKTDANGDVGTACPQVVDRTF